MSAAALSIKTQRGRSLRAQVLFRDGGVCALCGVDTEKLRERVFGLTGSTLLAVKKALGWPESNILWQADHTVPVAEGGPTTLDNLRTLCAFGPGGGCHGRETRDLAARRARRPNATRARARKLRRERAR